MLEMWFLHTVLSQVLDVEEGFETREALDLAVGVFAFVLLLLSLSAYRKTRLRRLILVSVAFGLFAVEIGITQLDDFVFAVGPETDQLLSAAMDLIILLLFFTAVVVRD